MPLSIYWSDKFAESEGYLTVGFYFICALIVIMLQHVVILQLADIRKNVPKNERSIYCVPKGYMFDYVTCPHFTLEILLYAIIHLILGLCWLPFTPTFIFVLSNQICSGVVNHMWYQKNYSDFAKSRKILIPFAF
nr:dfg10 protein [Hymenolepis microstoma]